jgi:hypothetical protein
MKSFPRIFAVYNKSTESFHLLQTEIEDEKIVRLKQWRRPDYSDWKKADDDEKITMMPWMTGQEWYIVPQSEREHAKGTAEIHDQIYSFSELPYDLIWSNYIIHRGRNSYTRDEWDTAPGVPVVELSSRRILPRELAEVHVRWSEVHPKLFLQSLEQEGETMLFPPLPNSDAEELESEVEVEDNQLRRRTRRARSWSDASEMLEEEIEDMCCSREAQKGCALLTIAFMTVLWVVALPMLVLAAR